jgi:hypothetical protein
MRAVRRRIAIAGGVALGIVGLLAQPAAAVHDGGTLDCGDLGTFTVRATPNGAGFEAPTLGGVILFEEGGRLIPLEVYRNGLLQWNAAAGGLAANAIEETTCSLSILSGDWVITGVLTGFGSASG